tara:strand:+ start:236 stop:1090 length:855 start_codon:yes stop_codon:yes gene_type:complete
MRKLELFELLKLKKIHWIILSVSVLMLFIGLIRYSIQYYSGDYNRELLFNKSSNNSPIVKPLISIVIDDVGLDKHRSKRVMALPKSITIAFLPYATDVHIQAKNAILAGHELILHMPMEPNDDSIYPGPNALEINLDHNEFIRRIKLNLDQFGGYVGVNNHMGSKLTSHPESMKLLIGELKKRGLFFLDSRTSNKTVGLDIALDLKASIVERNVFIDHDGELSAINSELARLEKIAEQNGYAVAIGHPKDNTLYALEKWIPEVEKRGFLLVPLSAVVKFTTSNE